MTPVFHDAVVIGKFYPPHKGHKYLIDTALAQAERVTVLVCERVGQTISGDLRAGWIKAIHPSAEVVVIDDTLPDDDSRAWAHYTMRILGRSPDVVFTSENYGQRYAELMGAQHVLVDEERVRVPVSGTMIRSDPLNHLEYLEPIVRAFFVKRVCLLGAESTGTTTMAIALARVFETVWVPEYGRLYWEGKMHANEGVRWETDEFVHIASMQCAIEDYFAQRANEVLICDTNAFVTCFWHERYMHFWSDEVESVGRSRRYDLYLVTDVDIPFVQDGTRDGESIRHWMNERFVSELAHRHYPYVVLSGSHENRLRSAIRAVKDLAVGFSSARSQSSDREVNVD